MLSVWSDSTVLPKFNKLSRDIKTDVLIIGGGITGILCAYMLHRAGIDYVLAEAGTICSGATKNTTAKITVQHGLIFNKMLNRFGAEKTSQYLNANLLALSEYKTMCLNTECDFENRDSCVYSRDDRSIIDKELDALKKIGFTARYTSCNELPFQVAGGVKFSNQAQFNPLKFIAAISPDLNIFEHTKVKELIKQTAITDSGKITANKIIAATHFPFINKHGSYFLKMYQHRSYELALEDAPEIMDMYVDEKSGGMSFRSYKDMLLIGGGGHHTGKQGEAWNSLLDFAKRYYPNAKEAYRWAAQDCMTLDHIPYIGRYTNRTQDFFVATGFNKWGMTSSMAAAMILTDMIKGKDNPNFQVFSPSRSIMRPQLAINAFEAVSGWLYPSVKRCPHLGCALKWNRHEHSWDCSCHGSRFTSEGKLIDNPATGNLKHR